MANSLYALGREAFLKGTISWNSDTIKAALVSTTYTPNLATDQFFNIIPGGAIIAAGVALGTKTTASGTAGAANTTWTAVSGSAAAYIVLYKDTGTPSTSPLIGLIDTAMGLPVTPNGGDIVAAWASGQIFTLFEGLAEKDKVHVWDMLLAWITGVVRFPKLPLPVGVNAISLIQEDPTPAQRLAQLTHWAEVEARAEVIRRRWEGYGEVILP